VENLLYLLLEGRPTGLKSPDTSDPYLPHVLDVIDRFDAFQHHFKSQERPFYR